MKKILLLLNVLLFVFCNDQTKQKKDLKKSRNIEIIKKEKIYKKIIETFSDAELIDVQLTDRDND